MTEKEKKDVTMIEDAVEHLKKQSTRRRRKGNDRHYRRDSVIGSVDVDAIPAEFPSFHMICEGKSCNKSPKMTAGDIIQPTSPKSPFASSSAFESVESLDDEDDMTDSSVIDITHRHTNGNANVPNHVNANGEPMLMPTSSITRSLTVAGDLHGVQPDPVAPDILRKEPEHETFVRLRISPSEIPSPDEVEVYRSVQVCLEMRKSYVFKEVVAPWEKEIISDPSTPKPILNPFDHIREGKSDHYFQMEDGVVHVYGNKDSKEKLFPVNDPTTFFTDLHHILKVIATVNTRTLCHHRLVLLEQKFNLHLMLNADREFLAQKSAPHRDFYNIKKVDTHVHHSACMNQKHLLRFIKSKLRKEPDEALLFSSFRLLF